jgi:hypothetical protein
MIEKNDNINQETNNSKEDFRVWITNPMTYDRLHTLSVEYSVSVELLVNLAVKRLVDDVDFVRSLRVGDIELFYYIGTQKTQICTAIRTIA